MAKDEIRIGDVGTIFRVTIKNSLGVAVDVSSSTLRKFTFRKPGGAAVDKTAVYTTDGTDGQIQYVAEADFLDVVGTWDYQATVTITAGTFHGDLLTFRVWPNV